MNSILHHLGKEHVTCIVVTIQSEEISPSITSSIFGFLEKFLDRPSSNPETDPNPVSKQAGGKHIKN